MSLGPLMIDVAGTSLTAEERKRLRSPLVAGVILFSRNFSTLPELEDLVAEIHGLRQPPLLVAVDQEGGRVQRFREPFHRLPPLRTLGRLHDEDAEKGLAVAKLCGWLMAAELRAVGVDLSFAPVVDLDLGLADVIGDRALHRKAGVVARLARELILGAEAAGMAATAKHYPSHAGMRSDSHTEFAQDSRRYEDLEDEFSIYRKLIAGGLPSIMVAHVVFPELDPLPASLSKWWIGTQLRKEMNYHGAIISDDVSMAGAAVVGGPAQRALHALDAGCDLVLVCNAPDSVPEVMEALEGYVNPAAQLRLMRLHGRPAPGWQALRATPAWTAACSAVDSLSRHPPLDLEG